MLPRWAGSCELTSTRIGGGILMAALEVIVREAVTVPFEDENAFGSTDTVTLAGVTPLDGEIVMPAVVVETENGVWFPPGSVIVKVWVRALRLQKFPRNSK